MVDGRQIGIRYCGGCNPRYDRVALVERIGSFFPEVEFIAAQAGVKYPAVLTVCGCLSRCVNVSDLVAPAGWLIYLSGWEELLPTKEKLVETPKGQRARSLTHEEVLDILFHREPMLFISIVSRLVLGEETVASFRARPELPCFTGHFPGTPVLLGIYIIEAAARAANTLMMTVECYAGMLPLSMGMREATLRQKILPGDMPKIHVSLLEERAERVIVACREQVFVEDVLTADLELRSVS